MIAKSLISEEEYFLKEKKAEQKSEYLNGEVRMMAGTSPEHNQISTNLTGELFQCLKKLGCEIYASDLLVHQSKCNRFVYPDITIVCENPIFQKNQKAGISYLTNPKIIIEVLSESTELYDRSEKFDCYKNIESLEKYVLVDSQKILVETYDKTPQGWLLNSFKNIEEQLKIERCEVLLSEIYRKISFE